MDTQLEVTNAAALIFPPMGKSQIMDQPWVKIAARLACARLALQNARKIRAEITLGIRPASDAPPRVIKHATMDEVAAAVGMKSAEGIYKWIRAGRIPKKADQSAVRKFVALSSIPIGLLTGEELTIEDDDEI